MKRYLPHLELLVWLALFAAMSFAVYRSFSPKQEIVLPDIHIYVE